MRIHCTTLYGSQPAVTKRVVMHTGRAVLSLKTRTAVTLFSTAVTLFSMQGIADESYLASIQFWTQRHKRMDGTRRSRCR